VRPVCGIFVDWFRRRFGWRLQRAAVQNGSSFYETALPAMPAPKAKVPRPNVSSLSWDDCRLLVESVADHAIFMLGADGRVTSWNFGAETIKGYEAHEIVGEHHSRFYPPEDVASGKPRRDLEMAERVGRVEGEGWRIRKDGSRFWASIVILPLREESGNLRGFGAVTRDLTDRRKAEATEERLIEERIAREVAEEGERQFRQSEERYRELSQRLGIVLEGVADGITVQDNEGRIVFANSAAATVCGFESADELMNTPPDEVIHRFEILDEHDERFDLAKMPPRRVLDGEATSSAVLHVRERRTGRDWWTLVRATAIVGTDGKPDLAVNIWHDVSAERNHERQSMYLTEATAALGASLKYDEMLSTLARVLVPRLADWCSIYIIDGNELRNVAVAHADPAKSEAVKEYQRKYPTGQRGVWQVAQTGESALYHEITDDMLKVAAQDAAQLEILRAFHIKAAMLAPIVVRNQVLGVISLVSTESRRHYDADDLGLAEELGRRAGVALENARLFREAQESARAAEVASRAKDEFLATVSHELRTPLNAILGWSTLLKDRLTDAAFVKPIHVIHRNAQRQVRLIDDIMDVSRVITGKLRLDAKPTDLVAITREAIEVIRPSAVAKQIDIEFAPTGDHFLLVADSERLQQVAWNLLSNAVKFTDAGGKVLLSLRQERASVILSVTDTGKGIEPEFLPFVFERFKQADSSTTRRVGGLGLGLALVRHIVELHGGQVAAASEGPGKGAQFTITLPIRAVIPNTPESTPRARASPPPALPASALNGVRVLVVDDEPDALDLIAAVLRDAGASVETARSAAEGFGSFKRTRPDVLVSDIGMPDEDGFCFIRRVRSLSEREGGAVPSLALTAFAREEDRTRAIAAGYTTHIGKPVDPAALATAVAHLASEPNGM
jgi:PAS domain S-box-containing protein